MNLKEFLIDGFPFLSEEKAADICDHWPLKIAVYRGEKITGLALYMLISDEALGIISNDLRYMSTTAGFDEIAKMHGNNLHVFCLHTKGVREIFTGLRILSDMCRCTSISWINKDMSKIIIIPEGRLCHKQS